MSLVDTQNIKELFLFICCLINSTCNRIMCRLLSYLWSLHINLLLIVLLLLLFLIYSTILALFVWRRRALATLVELYCWESFRLLRATWCVSIIDCTWWGACIAWSFTADMFLRMLLVRLLGHINQWQIEISVLQTFLARLVWTTWAAFTYLL